MGQRSDDLSPVWPLLGKLWAARQETVFASNGLGRWAPISRRAMLDGSEPLVSSGIMRDGLTRAAPRGSGKRFAAYGPPHGARDVMNPAVLHTVGTKHMPKRPPVPGLRAAERRAWVEAIRTFRNGDDVA